MSFEYRHQPAQQNALDEGADFYARARELRQVGDTVAARQLAQRALVILESFDTAEGEAYYHHPLVDAIYPINFGKIRKKRQKLIKKCNRLLGDIAVTTDDFAPAA